MNKFSSGETFPILGDPDPTYYVVPMADLKYHTRNQLDPFGGFATQMSWPTKQQSV